MPPELDQATAAEGTANGPRRRRALDEEVTTHRGGFTAPHLAFATRCGAEQRQLAQPRELSFSPDSHELPCGAA